MKNKFRSLLSMTLALMMIISAMSFATVLAADKGVIDGLYVDYSGESTVAYATDMAYSGSRSIAIDAKSDSHVWMGDPVGDFKMDPTKAYGLEFYIYVDSWTSGKIWLKPTGNDNNTYPTVYYASLMHGGNGLYLEDTNKDRWGLEKIESGEKAGWYRVWNTTAIISEDGDFSDVGGYGKGYMWYTEGEMKVKLDNINVYEWTGYTTSKNSGTRGDSPVFTQDFEEDTSTEEPTGPVIPDAADLDTENVNLTSHANTEGTYGVTNTFAHGGEHSLYVDSTTGLVGLGSCADDFNMVKGTPYGFKFSIYIAENQSGKLQIRPQNGGNKTCSAVYYTEITGTSNDGLNLAGGCKDRWIVTKDESTGWYSFESIYPIMVDNIADANFISGSMFYFEGKFKAFIDDVEIYNWTKEPVAGAGIANGMGTTLLGKRDFEPAAAPEPVVPEEPDAADLDTNVGLFKHTNTTGTYGITNTFAHSGEHSLYVDSTSGVVGLGSCAEDFKMEKKTPYGFKFSLYILDYIPEPERQEKEEDPYIQIKPQNGRNGVTKAVYYTTIEGTSEDGISIVKNGDRWKVIDEGNGWYTYKSKYPIYVDDPAQSDGKGTPDFLPGELFYFNGKFKAFIDDVEIYEWTANLATNAANENAFGELLANRDFEPTGDYISDFNVSASGNSVTVSVDIRNCTKDNYTAQLFLAVYDGNTLDFVEMTEKTTIAKSLDTSATPTTLEKTVTIPAGKTMKMYLWDSLEGMTPLKTSKLYE